MSGSKPTPTPPSGADDPSMEDILASIRRILSEDEAQGAPGAGKGSDDDVFQLDQAMMVPGSKPTVPPMARPLSPAAAAPPIQSVAEPIEPPALAHGMPPEPPQQEPTDMEQSRPDAEQSTASPASPVGLVAPEAASAAALSVGSLVRTLAAERGTRVHAGGPTIEDLVRQEIRPLLKEWLDANLPLMVERLVRAEIERVVGRSVL